MAFGTQTISNLGGAAGDIFGSIGKKASAGSYREAARISRENADLAQESANIKEYQVRRKAEQAIGGQQADVAGAGFGATGSAIDLLRDSQEQAALASALVKLQGEIDANSYTSQAISFEGQADAADAEAAGGIFGAVFKGAAAIATLFI